MADDSVLIEVEFDGKKGLVELKKQTEKAGDDISDSFGDRFSKGFSSALKVGAVAAAAAVGAVTLAFRKGIAEAVEYEKAVESFNKSLVRSGIFSEQVSRNFQDFAQQLQQRFAIADDELLGVAGRIQSIARLSEADLRRATVATANFSKALGIDLDSASRLVGKALEGNVSALQRYGIEVKKGATDAETLQRVLATLETRFKGAADATENTFTNALKRSSLAFNDVFEGIGNLVTQSPVAVRFINLLAESFKTISDSIKTFGQSQDIFKVLIDSVVTLGGVLNNFLLRPLEIIFNAGKTVFLTLAGAATLFAQALIELFSPVIQIGKLFGKFGNDIVGQFNAVRETVAKTYEDINQLTIESFDNTFKGTIANAVDESLLKLGDFAAQAPAIVQAGSTGIQDAVKNAGNGLIDITDDVRKAFTTLIVGTVTQGLQTLGAALVQGTSAFDSFKKTIFNLLGDFAIQVGTLIIGIGSAAQAAATALTNFFAGPVAIAAGLALIVLGGALKSLAGGPSASAGAGAVGAAGSVGAGVVAAEPDIVEQDDIQQRGPGTEVVINVEGNILDRRESGLAIAQVIQDYFDSNDGVLVRG